MVVLAKVPYVNIDKVKDLSKAKGISMKYWCDNFGKQRSYLADVRSGKNKLEEYELLFIVGELDTTVEYLTDETDDPAPKEKDPIQVLDEVEMRVVEILRGMSIEEKLELIEWLERNK